MLYFRYEHDREHFNIGYQVFQLNPAFPSHILERQLIHLPQRERLLLDDMGEVPVQEDGLVLTREQGHALLYGLSECLVLNEDVVAGSDHEKTEDRLKLLELHLGQ